MSEKRRRKSLSIFRPTLPTLSAINTAQDYASASESPVSAATGRRRLGRPASFFTALPSPASPSSPQLEGTSFHNADLAESPKSRPRMMQKSSRSSVFGSLRSLPSLDDDEKLTRTRSKESSIEEEEFNGGRMQGLLGTVVLHHGEVQTTGGMFRKRNQYLVLTDTHLIRFKGQSKASEMFLH